MSSARSQRIVGFANYLLLLFVLATVYCNYETSTLTDRPGDEFIYSPKFDVDR